MRLHSSREPRLYRVWLFGEKRSYASLEVTWLGWMTHVSFGFDDESGWGVSLCLPGLGFWLHADPHRALRLSESREVRVSVHDWALWWNLWRDPMGGWSSKDQQRWRDGAFHPVRLLKGRPAYVTNVLETRDVLIPMPEKSYPATACVEEHIVTYPRWFTSRSEMVTLDIPNGIPHEGKGESSWNCGIDGLYGFTSRGRSIPDAVGQAVGRVLSSRVEYGGWSDWTWNRPDEPSKRDDDPGFDFGSSSSPNFAAVVCSPDSGGGGGTSTSANHGIAAGGSAGTTLPGGGGSGSSGVDDPC